MNRIRASSARTRCGLTLMELLAVVVLTSLVAAVTTMGLASGTQAARMQAAAADWQDLDARARAFARTLGPVRMTLDDEGTTISLHRLGDGEWLSSLALPEGATGRLLIAGSPQPVVFDRLGRGADYDVELAGPDRSIGWSVCGLTGLIVRKES